MPFDTFSYLLGKKAGGGGSATLITKNITANGEYSASSDSADGYSSVDVNVTPDLTTKSITSNGTYYASADNVDGYSSVSVSVGGSDTWTWMGKNPTRIYQGTDTIYLKDTSYSSWTPSTTAADILASATKTTFEADMANYEYIVVVKNYVSMSYTAGTQNVSKITRGCAASWYSLGKISISYIDIKNSAQDYNTAVSMAGGDRAALEYYTNTGVLTGATTFNFGVYPTNTAPTFSSSDSNTPTVSVKSPKVSAKCNLNYFTTSVAAAVDADNSYLKIEYEVWRVDKNSIPASVTGAERDALFNNGL